MDTQNSSSAEQPASQTQDQQQVQQQQNVEPAPQPKRPLLKFSTIILLMILITVLMFPLRLLVNKQFGPAAFELTTYRIVYPALKIMATITDNYDIRQAADTLERGINAYKEGRYELSKESALHDSYEKLKLAFADNKDIDRNHVIKNNASNLQWAEKIYSEAQVAIARLKNGVFSSPGEVQNAIEKMDSLRCKIDTETAAKKRKKTIMSYDERRKENSDLLLDIILTVNAGYTYIVDSFGLNRKPNGAFGILSVNGYYKFTPKTFSALDLHHLEQLGFTAEKKKSDDLILFLLKSDDGTGDKYYGRCQLFDFSSLKKMLGYSNYYGEVWSSYVILNFEHTIRTYYKIRCSRLYLTRMDNKVALVADMRPEKWTKWTFSDHNIASYIPERLLKNPGYTISSPKLNSAYKPSALPAHHANIERFIVKDKAKNIVKAEGEATASLPRLPLLSYSDPNSAPPALKIPNPFRRFASGSNASAAEAEKLEAEKKYAAACRIYLKLARGGDYNSMEKYVNLLCTNKVYYRKSGKLLNNIEACNWALKMTRSRDAAIRGKGYYYLGLIYAKGGAGIIKNPVRARQFFRLAVQAGNSQASQLLKNL